MRNPPSGPFVPTAAIGLTAAKAFTSATPFTVPFDLVLLKKGDVGELLNPADSGAVFGIGPGLYLILAQFTLSVAQGTSLKSTLSANTGTRQNIAQRTLGAANISDSICLTAYLPPGDTPFDAGAGVFAGVGFQIVGTGTSGNVTAAELAIFQIEDLK